jgi:uncharacterized protein YdhG (YjbR/CyaY superfamily)
VAQSKAVDVDAYLAEQSPDRRAALTRLRELCRAELPGFTEVMAYGMPGYRRGDVVEISFAGQQQYISFYLLRQDVRDSLADRLSTQDMGKGCLRFRAAVDYELVRDLVRATFEAGEGPIC